MFQKHWIVSFGLAVSALATACEVQAQEACDIQGGYTSGKCGSKRGAATSDAQLRRDAALDSLSNSIQEWGQKSQEEENQKQLSEEQNAREKKRSENEANAKIQNKVEQLREDDSLNPWLKIQPVEEPKANNPAKGQNIKVSKNSADPSLNYEGQSCNYFTKQNDDAHVYHHSNGTMISYGGNIYVCADFHWKFITTTDHYWGSPSDTAKLEASRVENSK